MTRLLAMLLAISVAAACAPADGAEPRPESAAPTATSVAIAVPPATAAPAANPAHSPRPMPSTDPSAGPVPGRATTEPVGSAAPVPEPEPEPEPAPDRDADSDGARPTKPYSINLATRADFVPQYTFEWCVGASIQMARSIIAGNRNESRESQRRLWEMARERTIGSPYGGANPVGWASALRDLGLGSFRLVSLPTFDAAVDRAARAIVATRRPVGLVMWGGRHAWVMTGFEATANPRRHRDARVTRLRVMDPLYPHGSRWGPSPAPNELIRRRTLARQFVERNRPDYDFGVDPGWLLVLPVD